MTEYLEPAQPTEVAHQNGFDATAGEKAAVPDWLIVLAARAGKF
tara:strand:- start:517 stop:648 length:132 start_codon:yes stop_codon:yes gene_type:complete